MTIDPNLLSISLRLWEINRQLEEIHRFRLAASNKPCRKSLTSRSSRAWKARLTGFFLSSQPVN